MSHSISIDPSEVLDFWLGVPDEAGMAPPDKAAGWWKKDDGFDRMIRERFEPLYRSVMAGQREDWLETPAGRLAYVLVLDQFTRNMFRGSAEMYAGDELARGAVREGLEQSADQSLVGEQRSFFFMPLMHSEVLEDQEHCVRLFESFRDEAEGPLRERLEGNVKFAIAHRDIVARFGRFPHRNEILNRASTPDEVQFLNEPGSSF